MIRRIPKARAALLLALALAASAPAQAAPITFTFGIGVTGSTDYFNDGRAASGAYAAGSVVMFQFTADTSTPDRDTGSPQYAEYEDTVTSFRLGTGSWLTAAATGDYKTNSVIVSDGTHSSGSGRASTCITDCGGQWVSAFSFHLQPSGDHLNGPALEELAGLAPPGASGSLFRFHEYLFSDGTQSATAGSLSSRDLQGVILSISAVTAATVSEAPTPALLLAGLAAMGLVRRTRSIASV